MKTINLLVIAAILLPLPAVLAAAEIPAAVQTILRERCLTCHSTDKQEGELDLETADITRTPEIWEQVLEQIHLGEMPPKKSPPLTDAERGLLTSFVRQSLDAIAIASSGDPGPVVLRRLSNQEYTYTIHDLTGVRSLDPLREFPVDGAAGEGFTNVGAALVMSPSLLTKYLDAAKEISQHAVLLPDGLRFSPSTSPQDWTDETLARIRSIYAAHSEIGEASQTTQQGIKLDIGTGAGRLPLARYLAALQGKGTTEGLSPKYLQLLRDALTSKQSSPLLDPLREKFARQELTAADIEVWQQNLWRFATVGHIGKKNGPRSWQEPISPIVAQHPMRMKLADDRDTTLYLATTDAGGTKPSDEAIWSNARIVAPGKPDFGVSDLSALNKHLATSRQQIIASLPACLAAVAEYQSSEALDTLAKKHAIDRAQLIAWLELLERGDHRLAPLLTSKIDGAGEYKFIQGWAGENALSVLANSSDTEVQIPGTMRPHSIATHPSPTLASVIAWKSPVEGTLSIRAEVQDAHLACGNGVSWSLEVRRGASRESLSVGNTEAGKLYPLGPFENVKVGKGDVVALVIGPRDNEHTCDLTAVNLSISDGTSSWDLARDVSASILESNPHGSWHFVSQPAKPSLQTKIPEGSLLAHWNKATDDAERRQLAEQLQTFLARDRDQDTQARPADQQLEQMLFSSKSPLMSAALASFSRADSGNDLIASAPSVLELTIPAAIGSGAEFVVTGTLKPDSEAAVQMQILTTKPSLPSGLLPGSSESGIAGGVWSDNNLRTSHSLPVIAQETSATRKRLEAEFHTFRQLFPIALCYTRIVPVDEVVTLTLFYREDDHLKRLMLTDEQSRELDRLWNELYFISEAPLKQVDAFEQLYQFATQDASPEAFEPLRQPILAAAEKFKLEQTSATSKQIEAVIDFASNAWRRPLTEQERAEIRALDLPIRLRLARVLTSPAFLYRAEQQNDATAPVSDHELATRLSYFLWSSLPDAELRGCADRGELSDPQVLVAQTRRMLQDPRIARLSTEFGCQWLHVRDVATLDEKSERHFPMFASLRDDMQNEVTHFFTDLFQNDRSVMSLLEADHTFVNRELAELYGLTPTTADWHRVEGIRAQGRGGILGFAATLAKHSGASRTSPILRGTWLSEVLLGEKLPNPPQGVPVLPEETPEGLTERQLTERHSQDENCASCHRRVDPFGFALEGFDAIGRARTKDSAGLAIDTKTELPDGTKVEGLEGLRSWLATTKRDAFVRQYCRKLLGYALGRSVQLSDKPLLDAMLTQLSADNYRASIAIEKIVLSPQFREIRGKIHSQPLPSP
ncbi:Protein of unknown function DUF1592 [Pirellula staleyi DSM 6068]|uniref:Haem-binding domain-containing protein n=1 Tax=Pirellula staleyi (strain ATCC 27377 / DSM 6068 / ICPB 4128) TaxID=530564 RepID=D2QYJ3_PIRSD|nr:DUF1592 domain-containing protein [Pirellula staleyi]ADB18152.1 Protein of unknown function DUF1592 [Pirellula staleyi DSM 6068]